MPLRRGDARDTISESIRHQVKDTGLISTRSDTPLKVRNIRMSDSDWNRLKQFFAQRGISVSSGIRMIAREYLRQHG